MRKRVAPVAPAALLRSGLSFVLMLLVLLLVTFLIGKAAPIDPVLQVVGDRASPEAYQEARQRMGLDRPIATQFVRYVSDAAQGDLGRSTSTGRPVLEDLRQYFPATLELATLGIVLGVLFGVPLGMLAAHQHNRWIDQLLRLVGLLGYSVPVFWLGLVGLLVFYARLGWVGGPGRLDDVYQYTVDSWSNLVLVDTLRAGNAEAFRNGLSHLLLPAALLGYFSLAYISRMTRAFFLEELGKEYVMTARVKGASELRVLVCHVLPNVAAPLVTVIALSYAVLLEGAVLTETVFSWPGIGLYVTNALFSADVSAVLGGTLLVGLCFVVLNTASDVFGYLMDPRARS
jgi:peptide/nickel transport system permease protein